MGPVSNRWKTAEKLTLIWLGVNMKSFTSLLLLSILAVPAFAEPDNKPLFTPDIEINTPTGPVSAKAGVHYYSIEDLPSTIREEASRRLLRKREKGYVESTEEEVSWVDWAPKAAKPMPDIQSKIKVNLANLNGTPFAKLKFEGVVPEGPTFSGPWTSVSRIFSYSNGTVVILREWDYVADGGGILIQKEQLTESINGIPAAFGIQQSPKGKAISTISWQTDKKSYTLTMSGHVHGNGMYKKFIELANSIRD